VHVGHIEQSGNAFQAFDAAGVELGPFGSLVEAANAISTVWTRKVDDGVIDLDGGDR
jgi:hypothetical protein